MAQAALDGDLSAQRFDQSANEREAEAGAIRRCVEAAEDGWQALRLNAAAGVAHQELNFVATFFSLQPNGPAIGSKAKGIADQVVEDGANGAPVRADVRKISEAAITISISCFFASSLNRS